MFLDPMLTLPNLKSGKLRALGITGAKRTPWLPDIPTIAEVGVPGYEIDAWFGLLAPSGTNREIIDKIHQDAVSILNAPGMRASMLKLGVELIGNTPAQFGARIKSDVANMAKVVSASGARAD
jgi:tripartite-type tricarboxylate transporter receptor subunit TctC